MSAAPPQPRPIAEARLLFRYTLVAIIVVLSTLQGIGWQLHWFAHPPRTKGLDPDTFIEAEVVRLPEAEHLTGTTASRDVVAEEPAISTEVDRGRTANPAEKARLAQPEHNVTKAAPAESLPATHGPVAVYTPAPAIPARLASEDLRKGLVIEFFITAQGSVTPRLITSSDNDEVDAIALGAVRKWQFRPAEEERRPVDAKVRLRIVFDVE